MGKPFVSRLAIERDGEYYIEVERGVEEFWIRQDDILIGLPDVEALGELRDALTEMIVQGMKS